MKLICERDALHRAISAVASRARSAGKIPILEHIKLEAEGDTLRLAATDLDTRAEATCRAEVQSKGATCAAATRLRHVIAGMTSGAQVQIHLDASELHVRSGASRYRLQTLPSEDFPEFSKPADAIEFSLSCMDVKALFEDPQGAINLNKGRIMLEGGLLHQREPGKISMVGCDGTILICRSVTAPSGSASVRHIVPKAAMAEIAKLAHEGEMLFRVSNNTIQASTGPVSFISKLLDSTYPDIERLIRDLGESILVDRGDLVAAIKRLTALETENSHLAIAWSGPGQPLQVSLTGAGSGIEEITCECDFTNSARVLFASSVLGPLLDAVKGDVVRLHPKGGDSMRVVDPSDDSLIAMGMPIRDREARTRINAEPEEENA